MIVWSIVEWTVITTTMTAAAASSFDEEVVDVVESTVVPFYATVSIALVF